MIFNTVKSFHKKASFLQAKKFLVVQNFCPIATKLNKTNFHLSEVINFFFKSKVRKRIAFLTHLSTGLLRELEEDTSLNNSS